MWNRKISLFGLSMISTSTKKLAKRSSLAPVKVGVSYNTAKVNKIHDFHFKSYQKGIWIDVVYNDRWFFFFIISFLLFEIRQREGYTLWEFRKQRLSSDVLVDIMKIERKLKLTWTPGVVCDFALEAFCFNCVLSEGTQPSWVRIPQKNSQFHNRMPVRIRDKIT